MTENIREAGPEPAPPDEPTEPASAAAPADGSAPEAAGAPAPAGPSPVAAEPDYKDRWLRAEAEIQNTRRRASREREEAVRSSEERILIDMVEVLDDLERALAALPAEPAEVARAAWAQGVALTAQRLRDALARHGVSAIATLGEPFDPAFHEALLEIPAPEGVRPGAVAQEVQKGYRRGNRALRAARVVVARTEG